MTGQPPGSALVVRTAGGRVINPFDPDLPDPDMRRDPRAAGYHRSRLSEETRRKYRFFIDVYLDFCLQTGRDESRASQFTLEAFMVYLAQMPVRRGRNKGKVGLAPASMALALAAVRALYEILGENLPPAGLARGVIEGHEAQRRDDPDIRDGVGSPAVDLPTFQELVEACPAGTNAGLRDRAMLTLGLAIMARRRELTQLNFDDVTSIKGGWLDVHVRRAKGGRSRTAAVPPWEHLPVLDPVANWFAYRARMRELGVTGGPAFRAVDRWDNVQGATDSRWAGRVLDGGRMSPLVLELIIARAAHAARLDNADELRPHGTLRASGATIAYNYGADVLAIARQGGWAENSPVVFRYIRDVDRLKRNPMLLVGRES